MIKDDYKGKILQTFRPFLKMNLPAYFFAQLCPLSRDEILVFRQTPSFIIQITTLRFASACLDELRAFDILHNVFALQPEVIIKTLREYLGDATNVTTEAPASSYGMYY